MNKMDANPLALLEGTIEEVGVPSHYGSNKYNPVDELNQKLIDITLELQTLQINASEELMRKEEYIQSLILLIRETSQQRDEARNQLYFLLNNSSYITLTDNDFDFFECNSNFDNCNINIANSCHKSKCDKDNARFEKLLTNRPLPEKGKLLEAVMEAGPPLQWKNTLHHQVQMPIASDKDWNFHTLNQTAAFNSNSFVQSTLNDMHNAFSQGLWPSAKRQMT